MGLYSGQFVKTYKLRTVAPAATTRGQTSKVQNYRRSAWPWLRARIYLFVVIGYDDQFQGRGPNNVATDHTLF